MNKLNPTVFRNRKLRWVIYPALLVFAAFRLTQYLTGAADIAAEFNGFDLEGSTIPIERIEYGLLRRDNIPAIDRPRFIAAESADFMNEADWVVGLAGEAGSRAYPVKILNHHEIVNDRFSGRAVAVTYCPLCRTGIVYESTLAGRPLRFGVSGLLYNNDLLMYDRETESVWSQITGEAISGDYRGQKLVPVPVVHTTWDQWRAQYPDTEVLSPQTGYRRDYTRDPYADYALNEGLFYPVTASNALYPAKSGVIGLVVGDRQRAWPFAELETHFRESNQPHLGDSVAGKPVRVYFNPDRRSAYITDQNGGLLPGVSAYWFAWYAFYPNTEIFRAQ